MQLNYRFFVLVLLSIFSAGCFAEQSETRRIEVNGSGQVSAVPDLLMMSLSFSQRSQNAAQAKKLVDTQVTNLLKLCDKLGIDEKDIKAANLRIYPEYDYKNQRKLLGYNVQRDVQIKVKELENYSKLLEGAVGIGASHSGQVQLDFSNREALQDEALKQAFANAKRKAQLLADVADAKLGQALSIQAHHQSYIPRPMARMESMAADASASYPTGEQTINGQVRVVFELK